MRTIVGRPTVRIVIAAALVAISLTLSAQPAVACEGCPYPLFEDVSSSPSLQVNGTYRPIVGNFAGSPASDIFWYAPGAAADYLWVSSGRGSFNVISKPVSGTFTPLVGDFNGDYYDDILWYAPGTASDWLWTSVSTSAVFQSSSLPVNGTYEPLVLSNALPDRTGGSSLSPTRADAGRVFTAPRASIVWYQPGTGIDRLWTFDASGGHITSTLGIPGSPQLVALNANSDRAQDFLAYSPGSGPDGLYVSDGDLYRRTALSVNGTYDPVVVGNGYRDGVLWFGPGARTDAYWEGSSTGVPRNAPTVAINATGPVIGLAAETAYVYDANGPDRNFESGQLFESPTVDIGPGARPVVGDFDLDGRLDVLFYRPGAGAETIGYGYY